MLKLFMSGLMILVCTLSFGFAGQDDLTIDTVFFAQQHVLEPDHPHFGLVSELEALVKVQVYAEATEVAPYVFAVLQLGRETKEIGLKGPRTLPARPEGDPLLMEHQYSDSYTGIIPANWVRPGLQVAIELRDYDYLDLHLDDHDYVNSVSANRITVLDRRTFDDLEVGAPNRLVMNMFDFHFFGQGGAVDYPQGWEAELKAKLPIADLRVIQVPRIMMREFVMQPILGMPVTRWRSEADFVEKTGESFVGAQSLSMAWTRALKRAAGHHNPWRVYYGNICGVHAGGLGGQFRGVGSMHRHGILIHELGHAFGLPHWTHNRQYPYRSTMYGETPGEDARPNAGPHWAFDLGRRDFISPREKRDGALVWKLDPMAGGGRSNLKDYMFKHFSDYSVMRMRNLFNNRLVVWNEDLGEYARWNAESGAYDDIVENDGVQFPVERDVDVISILVTAHRTIPDANIVYAPIGPYEAGRIRLFDANRDEDRQDAVALGYTSEDGNVALRVTQGGTVMAYMLPVAIRESDEGRGDFVRNVAAINLSAADGEVTKVEMLYDPELVTRGLTDESEVLYTWSQSEDL